MTYMEGIGRGIRQAGIILAVLLAAIGSLVLSEKTLAATYNKTAILDGAYHTYSYTKGDTHYYTVQVPYAGELKFELSVMERYSSSQYLYMRLYEESTGGGQVFDTNDYDPDKVTSKSCSLSPGTYRLTIPSASLYQGNYRLRITYVNYGETNREPDNQYNPTVIAKNQEITGAFTYSDLRDWYQFTVPADNTKVRFLLNAYGPDPYLYIRHMDGTQVDRLKFSGGGNISMPVMKEKTCTLSRGTYLIELATDSYYGKYTLRWKIDGESSSSAPASNSSGSSNGTPSNNNTNQNNSQPTRNNKVTNSKITYNNVTYHVTNNNTVTVTNTNQYTTTISIPNNIVINNVSYPVTTIKANVFTNNQNIKKVIIGGNVTNIEGNAFYGCSNLKTIKIKSKKLASIGFGAFSNIKGKAKIYVPRSRFKAYKKMLRGSGLGRKVKIKKL